MYIIYLDVLFMINWVMDFLIFFTVTLILNKWIAVWRHFIAAALASILYCLLILFPFLQGIPYSIYSLWIPVMPILYLYKPDSLKRFVQYFLVSTGIAAVYGGVIFNIWNMLGGGYQKLQLMHLSMLFGISIGITAVFYLSFYWIRRCCFFKRFTYRVKLCRKQQVKEILALMDTGNLLYTPLYHEPVIVVAYDAAKDLLSANERRNIEKFFHGQGKEIESVLSLSVDGPEVLIPFNSIGCKAGFLWGIRLEEIKVVFVCGEKVIHHGVMGISKDPIHSDKQYEALLHPEYFLEEERVG